MGRSKHSGGGWVNKVKSAKRKVDDYIISLPNLANAGQDRKRAAVTQDKEWKEMKKKHKKAKKLMKPYGKPKIGEVHGEKQESPTTKSERTANRKYNNRWYK